MQTVVNVESNEKNYESYCSRLAFVFIMLCMRSPRILSRVFSDLCTKKELVSDDENVRGLPNYDGFVDHRHDQSIFSLLVRMASLRATLLWLNVLKFTIIWL